MQSVKTVSIMSTSICLHHSLQRNDFAGIAAVVDSENEIGDYLMQELMMLTRSLVHVLTGLCMLVSLLCLHSKPHVAWMTHAVSVLTQLARDCWLQNIATC